MSDLRTKDTGQATGSNRRVSYADEKKSAESVPPSHIGVVKANTNQDPSLSPSSDKATKTQKPLKHQPNDGSAKYIYPNGDIYEGTFENGLRHGNGVMVWADGRQYRGGWSQDMQHGKCEEVTADRTTYKGEYEMGMRHGQGLEISVYGDEYNGDWVKGLRHGTGDYFTDGLHYQGEWKDGRRHGRAKCVFRNGDMYEGNFVEDLMEGKGTMLMASGCKYTGAWHLGKMEGQGRLLYPSGDVYEGDFKAGSRSGFGKYTSVNGSVYEGEFKNGKRHGKGKQTSMIAGPSSNKTTIVPFRLIEGETYDGEWKNGKRSGFGTLHIRGRLCYEGNFLNNERDGEGKAFFKDRAMYEGSWKDGKMHGSGCMESPNGKLVEGVWEGGVCKQVLSGEMPEKVETYNPMDDSDMMQSFEKGKSRLLRNNPALGPDGQPGRYPDEQSDGGSLDQSGHENRENTSSVGFLHDIHEEEEDPMAAFNPSLDLDRTRVSEAESFAHFAVETTASQENLPRPHSGRKLPSLFGAGTGAQDPQQQEQNRKAAHDQMVEIAGRHGVPIRGTFDGEGNYVPPVSQQTLLEWNTVNHLYVQSREKRRPSSRGASPYTFDASRQPGYGEGGTPKLAKANVPIKTDSMVAGPGEFSFRRWRAERGPF